MLQCIGRKGFKVGAVLRFNSLSSIRLAIEEGNSSMAVSWSASSSGNFICTRIFGNLESFEQPLRIKH